MDDPGRGLDPLAVAADVVRPADQLPAAGDRLGPALAEVLGRYRVVTVRVPGLSVMSGLLCRRPHQMAGATVLFPQQVRDAEPGDRTALPGADWIVDQRDLHLDELVQYALDHEDEHQ